MYSKIIFFIKTFSNQSLKEQIFISEIFFTAPFEFPESDRMHLHDYNNEIRERKTKDLQKITQPFVLKVSCKEWKLRPAECN